MKEYVAPPEGFNIGGFEIKFYGLIMAFSMLVGLIIATNLAKKHKIKSDDVLLLALIVLPLSIIGARLYYCFFYDYSYSFKEILNLRSGGMAIYGGVLGGALGVLLFGLIKHDFKLCFKLMDICAPALILGQAFGRIGCFFAGCCYGVEITNPAFQWFPLCVIIKGKWCLSTFFIESLWNLIGFFVLLLIFKKSKRILTTTGAYFVWYGFGRAIIEQFRGDSLHVSDARVSQILSIILFIIGLVILVYNYIKTNKGRAKHE